MARQTVSDPWAADGMLTTALVKRLVAAPPAKGNKRRPHRGGGMGGFELVITSAGAGAYAYRYRDSSGRERYYTIGDAKAWPLAKAETEYHKLRQQVEAGGDPAAERKGQRDAPTIADLAERFRLEHMPKLRPTTRKDYLHILDKLILPALKNVKVSGLRHVDVERLHSKVAERAPYMANRMLGVLSKMLSLAVRWELTSTNPCAGVEHAPEHQRRRYLSSLEIAKLAAELDRSPEQISANAIRLILFTGARRAEALSAEWSQIDLAAGLWIKPARSTKQNKEHRVPLNAPALALLTKMRAEAPLNQTYLFPSGIGHLIDIRTMWEAICRRANIPDARLHDLRHTFASTLATAGLSLQIIGELLGHAKITTTQRYAHLQDDAVRAATERAGSIISSALDPPAEVMPFKKRGYTGSRI